MSDKNIRQSIRQVVTPNSKQKDISSFFVVHKPDAPKESQEVC